MGKRKKSNIPVTSKGINLGSKKSTKNEKEKTHSSSSSGLRSILKKPKHENQGGTQSNGKSALTVLKSDIHDESGAISDSIVDSDLSDSDEELFVQEVAEEHSEKTEEVEANDMKNIEKHADDEVGCEVSEDSDWDDTSDSSGEEKDEKTAEPHEFDKPEEENESDSDEDEVVAAIRKATEPKARRYPRPITLETEASAISFHPYKEVIAVGDMDGTVLIHKYSNEENQLLYALKNHGKRSVRCVEFSDEGNYLISACRGQKIVLVDSSTAKPKAIVKEAHESSIYCIKSINENMFASGDDDGFIKLWDVREKSFKAVCEWKDMDEFVTCIAVDEDERTLLATSGEGTLTAFNLRQRKMKMQSEVYESEMNSVAFVREGSKVLAGSGNGMISIFNRDEYGYHSDTFGDHPDAINALIPITENIVATACEDGSIRALHLFPHRFIGVIGSHQDASDRHISYPVERLDISTCGHYLASVSHNRQVKFWNISYFEEIDVSMGEKSNRNKKKSNRKNRQDYQLPSSNMRNISDFFQDLAEE
ncbi:WD repeat-containing protein 55 homolog [Artemia franciscana]|uniref:WD repeat-containing protein 55 homolog n=1 Tax=Artemia franciscana TaxID=6661 RepID=A0AA88HID4_ARTSF|nr:hypothetical protein QYM36_011304 [Artemia franciscana]KAK2712570.1 hypothetical protein QYM36_011304 [Artemia franciscana]